MAYEWDVAVGELLSRDEIKARFGGATMGGIQPSRLSPNVLVFSDPTRGHRHGYVFDGWDVGRDVFLYTGEGRIGPQKLIKGNKALLDHRDRGRSLRVFVADGKVSGRAAKLQRYLGEFGVDPTRPWVQEQAPDDERTERSVFVFRLRPIGTPLIRDIDLSQTGDVASLTQIEIVEFEAGNVMTYPVPGTSDREATRREHEFVQRFCASLAGGGSGLKRLRLKPPGLLRHLFTDVYDHDNRELFEVKATNSREAVRTALGQLLDYREWIEEPVRSTVVIAGYPPVGMVEVLNRVGVGLIYEDPATGAFIRRDPPAGDRPEVLAR